MFRRLVIAIALLGVTAAVPISCNREKPSITPKLQINKKSAEMGTPIEVTYSFSTKKNYVALFKDMTVFVHFIDPRGVRRFQDDHQPPKPTRDWRPEGNYNYTRTVFIPKNIPAGEYDVVLGIYSPTKGERVPMEGKQFRNRAYQMSKLLIEIPPQEPVMQFASGWYDPESEATDIGTSWRWTKKEAVLKVRNPNADALLYLKVDGVPERFKDGPQNFTVTVGQNAIDTFPITTNMPISKKYNVPQSSLGDGKTVEVRVSVDKTFIPAQIDSKSRDTRELGVRIYQLYLGKAID